MVDSERGTLTCRFLETQVKRQRNQYKALYQEGKTSSLSSGGRLAKLESLGFVWDSRRAGWEERWQQLAEYQLQNGHCNVPKKYPSNQPLSIWVKVSKRIGCVLLNAWETRSLTRGPTQIVST